MPVAEKPQITNAVIPIEKLKPHKRNYRYHPEKQLQQLEASHQRFGQFRSVVLWKRPNDEYIIVAGHGIVEGMRRDGAIEVRADVLPEETPQRTIDAILLADNLHAENGQNEEKILFQLLQEQQETGEDFSTLGFDEQSFTDMFSKLTPPTLDELTEQYGDEAEEDTFWPIIRVKVKPETKELYDELLERADGKNEREKFTWLLHTYENSIL